MAADNSGGCYCHIYRHILPFMCHVKMRGQATESSLFGQLANALRNKRRCAATAPNTSQYQQLGRWSIFGDDLFLEPRWPFTVKLNTGSFQGEESACGFGSSHTRATLPPGRTWAYTLAVYVHSEASTGARAEMKAAAEPWNIFIRPCSHGNKWKHISVTTLFSSQKRELSAKNI